MKHKTNTKNKIQEQNNIESYYTNEKTEQRTIMSFLQLQSINTILGGCNSNNDVSAFSTLSPTTSTTITTVASSLFLLSSIASASSATQSFLMNKYKYSGGTSTRHTNSIDAIVSKSGTCMSLKDHKNINNNSKKILSLRFGSSSIGTSNDDFSSSCHHRRMIDGKLRGGSTGTEIATGTTNNYSSTMKPFYSSTNIITSINVLGFIISYITPKLHYHVDILGTGAFAIGAIASYQTALVQLTKEQQQQRTSDTTVVIVDTNKLQLMKYSTYSVVVWSSKLALFLFYRIIIQNNGHDTRLDDMLLNPYTSAQFWFISGLWGIVCSLPHSLGCTTTNLLLSSSKPDIVVQQSKTTSITNVLSKYIGGILYISGVVIETIADYQKWNFKINPTNNKNMCCTIGVWSLSQHPNWVGNILLWSGIFILNIPLLINNHSDNDNLSSSEQQQQPLLKRIIVRTTKFIQRYTKLSIAVLGPMFMIWLFTNEADGTLLKESYDATRTKYGYGSNPSYTKYIDTTPLLFPNPFKKL